MTSEEDVTCNASVMKNTEKVFRDFRTQIEQGVEEPANRSIVGKYFGATS